MRYALQLLAVLHVPIDQNNTTCAHHSLIQSNLSFKIVLNIKLFEMLHILAAVANWVLISILGEI